MSNSAPIVRGVLDLADSTQHLKDLKLAIEFKYLMKHAPGGIYLLPEFENIRKLHGVIFIRRGLYRNGVFRFQITLPKEYNSVNTHPEIVFTPPVFNPLIHPSTGVLDVSCDSSMRDWRPETHFLVQALSFLKKIFYVKSFESFSGAPNTEAIRLLESDKDIYLQKIEECVEWSQKHILDSQRNAACPLIFTEYKPAHASLRDSIIEKAISGTETYASPAREEDEHYKETRQVPSASALKEIYDDTSHIDRLSTSHATESL